MKNYPPNWIETSLDKVAQWGSGGTPSRRNPDYYGGEIPWLKTGELGPHIITSTQESISELGLANSSAKVFPKGAVVIAMYGATIGKTSILGIDTSTNQACAVGIPHPEVTTIEYLYYYLCHQKKSFIEAGKGGAQPNISQKVIKQWVFPLPPLNEQKKIAEKLEQLLTAADATKNRLDKVPNILKRFRQSVLAAAVSGELTRGWRDGKDISSWEKLPLEKLIIGKPRNGYSPRAVSHETDVKSLTLTATTSGVFNSAYFKYLDSEIPNDSHLWLEDGDILIQRGNTLEYVGVSAIYRGPRKTFIYPDLMMKVKAQENILTGYLHYSLLSEPVREYFRNNATGTAGNMPKINQKVVMTAPISVPPLNEQQEIVSQVDTLFALADLILKKQQKAQQKITKLRSSILSKAFRGELVPQVSNDEPASELLKRIRKEQKIMAAKTKKKPMRKLKTERTVEVKTLSGEILKNFPRGKFSFDELSKEILGKYEDLKKELFLLLERGTEITKGKQLVLIFDKKSEQMFFQVRTS